MSPEYDSIDLTGLKVLVAESDRLNLIKIYELLTSLGIQVIVTHKSIDAVEKHLVENPDVILLNVEMADTKHIDAIRIIRKNESPTNRIPIIGLVADPSAERNLHNKNEAPDDVMINTFDTKELLEVLGKLVPKKVNYLRSINQTLENSTQVFNAKAFEELTNNDKNLIESVLGYFVKDIPELIIKLRVAAVNKYFEEIEYFAHSLKGIAANVYAEKLKITAYHIEILGKTNDKSRMNECNTLIAKLDQDYQLAKKAITDFLTQKNSSTN